MRARRSQRKISNVRLTSRFHLRYMGTWVLVCLFMLGLLNAVVYVQFVSMWGAEESSEEILWQASLAQGQVAAGMIIASCACACAIFALAIITAHRIGGPLLGLKRTLGELSEGQLDTRLHFREYDGLKDLEEEFNAMIDALQKRVEELEEGKPLDAAGEDGETAATRRRIA